LLPILKEAYGYASLAFEVPNRVDTKFNLGSMNKMFTGVAISQLAEKGNLSFDDRIIDHIPDYPNEEIAGKVTIHQLLTHTSGLGNYWTEEYMKTSKDRFRAVEDYLPLFVDQPLLFEPGTSWSYSNSGFMVLGLIIESITGQSYFDYVMENIYKPAGMINTDAYELDYIIPNLAVGYTRAQARAGEFYLNPESSNSYDSLGEAYLVAGKKDLAIENYKKSVELDPENTNGIEMLKRLRSE